MICNNCVNKGKIYCHEALVDEENCTRFEPRFSLPDGVVVVNTDGVEDYMAIAKINMIAKDIGERIDDAVIQAVRTHYSSNWGALMEIDYSANNLKAAISRSQPRRPRIDSRDAYCPQCGKYVGYLDGDKTHYDNFCSECGQRIDGRIE